MIDIPIDIPLGKALVPVLARKKTPGCDGCIFAQSEWCTGRATIDCTGAFRKDGKRVMFKLVDYPVKDRGEDE